jgi:DNA-binding IclR family transcriptional regulator
LADELDETVNLAVLDNGAATNITQVYGTAAVTTRNWIGQRTPLHATSSGKILLAWADEQTLEDALDTLERFTPHTITSRSKLLAELERTRDRGWASTSQELEIGLNAVAAPIRDASGEVAAAVSVSGPAYRLTVDSFPSVTDKLRTGADEISTRIGYFGD